MKGILITVVDVLGIFVPGFLLFVGIIICPPLSIELSNLAVKFPHLPDEIVKNFTLILVLAAIISYVLGFLIRLCSIGMIHIFTKAFWTEKLGRQAAVLEKHILAALNDEALCDSLKIEAGFYNKYTLNYQAPYFGFVKRIIKMGNPTLYSEAERLEAEIKFSTGIFVPLLLFVTDGIWIWYSFGLISGFVISMTAFLGVLIILLTFPNRRIKEVTYTYYLALILLQYGPSLLSMGQKADVKPPPSE